MAFSLPISAASTVILPNLILAGAPKSGTSSLFALLAAHPEICASTPKETFYFVDQHNPLLRPAANYHATGLEAYRFFAGSRAAKARYFLEGTTHYLYQQTALEFFAGLASPPQLIFLLRKPADRIFSSFSYTQNNLARLDKTVSFAQFTDLLLEGNLAKIRDKFYSEKSFFVLSHDLHYSEYETFLSRWRDRLPPENLHIFLFEQLIQNPQSVLETLIARLGLHSHQAEPIASPQNQTRPIKHALLHRTLRQVAPHLPDLPIKQQLKSLYLRLQSQPDGTPPDRTALQQLDRYFAPHNQRLAAAFDLDLSAWSS